MFQKVLGRSATAQGREGFIDRIQNGTFDSGRFMRTALTDNVNDSKFNYMTDAERRGSTAAQAGAIARANEWYNNRHKIKKNNDKMDDMSAEKKANNSITSFDEANAEDSHGVVYAGTEAQIVGDMQDGKAPTKLVKDDGYNPFEMASSDKQSKSGRFQMKNNPNRVFENRGGQVWGGRFRLGLEDIFG